MSKAIFVNKTAVTVSITRRNAAHSSPLAAARRKSGCLGNGADASSATAAARAAPTAARDSSAQGVFFIVLCLCILKSD